MCDTEIVPLYLSWEQVAVRLALACVVSFLIGLNRDEHGHPAGIRTTMLVWLAATLAMLQVNLLLAIRGKPQTRSPYWILCAFRSGFCPE